MDFNFDWNFVSAGAPYVTISNLSIAFNSISISLLKCPEFVLVGFDKSNLCIGVKAYNGEQNAKKYEFAKKMKNNWIRLGAKDFIKHLSDLTGNDYSTSKKYTAQFDEEKNILFVKIGEN